MELIIYIKMDLALNNLQRLICHKIQPNQNPQKNSKNSASYTQRITVRVKIYNDWQN